MTGRSLALAGYLSDPARPPAAPAGLFVLTVAGQQIQAITRFHLDELHPRGPYWAGE